MPRFTPIFLVAFLMIALGPAARGASAPSGGWEEIDRSDGVVTYKREVPGSDVLAFRGEGDVDAPIAKLATIIFDTTRAKEWVEDLEESRLVHWLNPLEFYEYDHVGTPFIIKDRDFVSKVDMKIDPVGHKLIFAYEVADGIVPETRFVRGTLDHTRFVLTSMDGGARTHIDGEIHCDPKGSVPKWLVNHFQKEWGHTTLRRLREQAAKTDIVIEPRFAKMFASFK